MLLRKEKRILLATVAVLSAYGQDGLKTIDNPGGGQIVYGPVTGQSSLPGAMGAVLRHVHSRFGERPQIGRFFQARGRAIRRPLSSP